MLCARCPLLLKEIEACDRTLNLEANKSHVTPCFDDEGNMKCRDEFILHDTYGSVLESAEAGCWICVRVSSALHSDPKWPPCPTTLIVAHWPLIPGMYIRFLRTEEYESSPDLGLVGVWLNQSETPRHASPGPLSPTIHIEESGKTIQKWLEHCVESHPHCESARRADWYPTRLLDLGSSSHGGSLKLIETSKLQIDGPYVTLSHCWGQLPLIKLTQESLPQFKEGISLDQLPKTFVDAAIVARYFGIRYLWIDSLTIIQGCTQDWTRESSPMNLVYQNALFNIGSTASSDSNGGLFCDRSSELVLPHPVNYAGQKCRLKESGVRISPIDHQPLMRRGWVVQERWLCPRMIHFSREQIVWECGAMVVSETDAIPKVTQPGELKHIGNHAMTPGLAVVQWSQLVSYFSRYELTFFNVRLAAMSGMAKVTQNHFKCAYVAGLWRSNFVFQLAWTPISRRSLTFKDFKHSRPNEYTAPSWSWVSLVGEVGLKLYWQPNEDAGLVVEHTSLLDIYLKYKTSNIFRQLEGGFVRVIGPLFKRVNWKRAGYSTSFQVTIDTEEDNDTIINDGGPTFLIALHTEANPQATYPPEHKAMTGLVLKRLPSTVDCFVRIGLCSIFNHRRSYYGHDPDEIDRMGKLEDNVSDALAVYCGVDKPEKIDDMPDELFNPRRGYTIKLY